MHWGKGVTPVGESKRLRCPKCGAPIVETDTQCMSCGAKFYDLARDPAVCPKCGGRLDQVSLPEHRLLPHDTEIIHRSYRGPSGRIYMVSVVVTGHERRPDP